VHGRRRPSIDGPSSTHRCRSLRRALRAEVRAGHALDELPALRAAFAEGRISFDKIRAVTKVATPDDDEMWLLVALHALAASSPASAAAFGAHSKPTIRAAAAVPT